MLPLLFVLQDKIKPLLRLKGSATIVGLETGARC